MRIDKFIEFKGNFLGKKRFQKKEKKLQNQLT